MRSLAGLAVAAMVFALPACGGGDGAAADSRPSAPPSAEGAFWAAYETLADAEIADPSAIDGMNLDERLVLAFGELRSEVNSGGFERYFTYGGNDISLAAEAAQIVSEPWNRLVLDARSKFGDSYPADQAAREEATRQLSERDEDVFERLDQRLYDLEAEDPADDKLDAYVWARRASFFA